MLKGKKTKLPALILAVILLLATSLSGCGGAPAQSPAPSRESTGGEKSSFQSRESSKAPGSSESSSASSKPEAEETLRVGPGIDDIAQLTGLKADVETYSHKCVVDVDAGENSCDVTWDYGKLYDAFVLNLTTLSTVDPGRGK